MERVDCGRARGKVHRTTDNLQQCEALLNFMSTLHSFHLLLCLPLKRSNSAQHPKMEINFCSGMGNSTNQRSLIRESAKFGANEIRPL